MMAVLLVLSFSGMAYAGDQSDDNSLSDLGIVTEGVTVSPDFSYDHLNYDVVVPAGTAALELSPVLSNPNATINSIEGTELTDGAGTVTITTTAPSGAMTAYTLNVTSAAAETSSAPAGEVDPAQAVSENDAKMTEAQTQAQTEAATEDPRYVKVDRNTLTDAENTITRLQDDLAVYKDRAHVFTYVIYALIAVCVVLLFLMINLLLKAKDLGQRLKEYTRAHHPQEADDSGDVIPEDGWLDDAIEEPKKKKKKERRKKETPHYDEPSFSDEWDDSMMEDGYRRAQTSWTSQQVGTPMEMPKRTQPYNGYARKSSGSDRMEDTRMYRPAAQEAGQTRVPGGETRVLRGRAASAEGSPAPAGARMKQDEAEPQKVHENADQIRAGVQNPETRKAGLQLQIPEERTAPVSSAPASPARMTRAEAKAAAKAAKAAARSSKRAARAAAETAEKEDSFDGTLAVPAQEEAYSSEGPNTAPRGRQEKGTPQDGSSQGAESNVKVDMVDL